MKNVFFEPRKQDLENRGINQYFYDYLHKKACSELLCVSQLAVKFKCSESDIMVYILRDEIPVFWFDGRFYAIPEHVENLTFSK